MNVSDLIAELERILEQDGDLEVLLAIQPHYPLAHHLAAVTTDLEARDEDDAENATPAVWLAASEGHPSGRSPYAPRGAWR